MQKKKARTSYAGNGPRSVQPEICTWLQYSSLRPSAISGTAASVGAVHAAGHRDLSLCVGHINAHVSVSCAVIKLRFSDDVRAHAAAVAMAAFTDLRPI